MDNKTRKTPQCCDQAQSVNSCPAPPAPEPVSVSGPGPRGLGAPPGSPEGGNVPPYVCTQGVFRAQPVRLMATKVPFHEGFKMMF